MNPDSRKIRLLLELRRGGVADTRVLGALEKVPRELFVATPFRDKAYENVTLPIGHHQTISQPLVVGLMTQALKVTDRTKVLEIGTGSGYQAAVLAPLCRRLYTVERHRDLLRDAEGRFAELGITNIVTRAGDGSKGWPEQAPFDRIIVTAAAADVPPVLVSQLAVGGIMVVPVGHGTAEDDQRLLKVTRTEDGADVEDMGKARFVPFIEGDGD